MMRRFMDEEVEGVDLWTLERKRCTYISKPL